MIKYLLIFAPLTILLAQNNGDIVYRIGGGLNNQDHAYELKK